MIDEKCFLKIEDYKEGIVKYPEYVETATYSEKKEEIMRRIEEKKRLYTYEVNENNKENVFQDKKEH